MSNKRRTVFYVGMTNSLERRLIEHRSKFNRNSFTSRYNISDLLYFEEHDHPMDAIRREKIIKGWTRQKKLLLVEKENPEMKDLFPND